MSEAVPPNLSLWELEQKARAALEERARDHERWKREESWDRAATDVAGIVLIVNALSTEVRDFRMEKEKFNKWMKRLMWFWGVFLTALMAPLAAWIWTLLTKIHISAS